MRLTFPDTYVLYYSVAFFHPIVYNVVWEQRANGGLYYVPNSTLSKRIDLEYDKRLVEMFHFVIPSDGPIVEILASKLPVVKIGGETIQINREHMQRTH
jgi:hypothetical protein